MTNFDDMMNDMCCNFDDRIDDICCNFDDTMDDMCCRHDDMDDMCCRHDDMDDNCRRHDDIDNNFRRHDDIDNNFRRRDDIDNNFRRRDDMDNNCRRHEHMDDNCPNHDNCNRSNFRTSIRTEFIIKARPQTICNVLQEFCGQEVRIDGYSIQSICDGCSIFRFVVGNSDCQSITDVQLARSILCDLSIEYLEDAIIKVTSRDRSPLELAKLYCALQRKAHVNASYAARRCGLYFQADPIEDALNALKGGICQ